MKRARRNWAVPLLAGALTLAVGLSACGEAIAPSSSVGSTSVSTEAASGKIENLVTISDSTGQTADIPENPRVVSLYGSYSAAWMLAGGALAGVTEDAISERGLDVGDAKMIGTVKEPSAEAIIALEPDLVLLSLDIAAQQDMVDVLRDAGLACLSYRVDTFGDYSAMMYQFCKATGQPERFDQYVSEPAKQLEAAKEAYAFQEDAPRVLLIRAFSSGIKAKTDDELAGTILKDLGCHNIADDHPSMLEDLSLEEVIAQDPDYIFITTMGDEDAALAYLDSMTAQNPAWNSLTAIQQDRCHVLPKDLFHYKPNERWGESYEYLGALLHE